MKFSISKIMLSDCGEFWHEALSFGKITGAAVELDDKVANSLRERCPKLVPSEPQSTLKPVVQPAINTEKLSSIPSNSWPIWAKAVAKTAIPGDKGIGDVIARTIGPFGGDAFKTWYEKIFGRPCKCNERQETLNMIYPLRRPEKS